MKISIASPKLLSVVVILAAVLLVMTTIPKENKIVDQTLIIKCIIGEKTINLDGAQLYPVSDDIISKLHKVTGSSLGKIKSGRFRHIDTKERYTLYITGKGDCFYFESDGKKYIIDGISAQDMP